MSKETVKVFYLEVGRWKFDVESYFFLNLNPPEAVKYSKPTAEKH
jgi:hypothetical protein